MMTRYTFSIISNGIKRKTCMGIHWISHQLTAKYGIDHGPSLAIVSPVFLELFLDSRKKHLSKLGKYLFNIIEENEILSAKLCIESIKNWIKHLGLGLKVSDYNQCDLKDSIELTKMVMESMGNKPFGFNNSVNDEIVHTVVSKILI